MVQPPPDHDPQNPKWYYQCGVCGTSFDTKGVRDYHQQQCPRPQESSSGAKFEYPPGYQRTPPRDSKKQDFNIICECLYVDVLLDFSLFDHLLVSVQVNMVRTIRCKLNNPYGPNCQSAETRLCVICSFHFRSGGNQRRHRSCCGYSTRCIRQLVDHIITMQIAGIDADEVDFAVVDLVEGETHRVSCICVGSTLINDLK